MIDTKLTQNCAIQPFQNAKFCRCLEDYEDYGYKNEYGEYAVGGKSIVSSTSSPPAHILDNVKKTVVPCLDDKKCPVEVVSR